MFNQIRDPRVTLTKLQLREFVVNKNEYQMVEFQVLEDSAVGGWHGITTNTIKTHVDCRA